MAPEAGHYPAAGVQISNQSVEKNILYRVLIAVGAHYERGHYFQTRSVIHNSLSNHPGNISKYCPPGNIPKYSPPDQGNIPISQNIAGLFKHEILENIFSVYNKYIYIFWEVSLLGYM